jgi:glutamine amidotransferase-like uncharacterized protein
MKSIYIYDDYGVSKFCVDQLEKCLTRVFTNEKNLEIRRINADCIKSGILADNGRPGPDLLCFGGGFDLGYLKGLGEDGCKKIRDYVYDGGNYLGICAGAYFAASYIEFDLNGPLEVKGERHLKFFHGKCVGPLNHKFKYNCDDEAIAIELDIDSIGSDEATSACKYFYYLNGGGVFLKTSENLRNCEILARYKTIVPNEAAIVKTNYGYGKCLLSGVHLEFDKDDLDLANANLRNNVYEKLFETSQNKYILLGQLLREHFLSI